MADRVWQIADGKSRIANRPTTEPPNYQTIALSHYRTTMKNKFLALITILFFASACRAPNEATPAPIQNATATLAPTVAPINTRTDRRAPTLAPPGTATLAAAFAPSLAAAFTPSLAAAFTPSPPTGTATLAAAFTPTLAPTFTALSSPTSARPNASPIPTLARAVYVMSFSIDPPAPKSKPAQFLFHIQFLNTTGDVVQYPRWRVLIVPKGQTKAVGDPQGASKDIANGASEQQTEFWSIKTALGCEAFTAQPVWENEDAKQTPFLKPDGKNIVLEFQVCP